MAISREVVLRLAEMTRIGLKPDEADALTVDMAAILTHVSRLQEVDTTTVDPGEHITGLHDISRPDVVTPSLPVEEVLANAPERHENFFVVPAVFGE
ncbi:MAG TPA: Asp-tRNA(Asn)/Glu-tRNA(Gln) amidotransferase subunit GatC [Chloroflexota bacterium]|nr:Asp-tRNA(Asn)/Glu-tRNA(Gln) amidotransferase subunit GatC [Chloroflexota bacterium]